MKTEKKADAADVPQEGAATAVKPLQPAATLASTDNSKNAYLQARRQQRANQGSKA